MKKSFKIQHQYKKDLFEKLDLSFERNKKLLDVGCGDGSDAEIFINLYGLKTYGIDIYKDKNIDRVKNLLFKKDGIYKIPFKDRTFDYVFLHDVLHHIDEENQSYENHIKGLKELKRVCKKSGYIIIVEANRYNPLFYPHMVLMHHHNHFKQKYFKKIVEDTFKNVRFKFFECHFYPPKALSFWKIFEYIMEKYSPKEFLAYNVAIIKNE